MSLTPDVLSAVIGACGALLVVLFRDGALHMAQQRWERRRELVQLRIEQAYAPVEFAVHRVLHAHEPQQIERHIRAIEHVLRHHSHLLSEPVISALYTFIDDPDAGAGLLKAHFFTEFAALKREFAASWQGSPVQQHGPWYRRLFST
jgi:hypothetical protein